MVALCAHAGLDAAVEGAPLEVRFNGPSDGEAQRQIDLIAQATERRAYGIVMMSSRLYSANGVVHQAVVRGIPVVVLLHPLLLPAQQHLSSVVEDVQVGAKLAATRAASGSAPNAHVLLAGVEDVSTGGQERLAAVEAALQQRVPQMPVVLGSSHSPGELAFMTMMEEVLARDHQIGSVIALDARAGLFAATVLHRQKLRGRVKLIAFDQSAEVLAALRGGDVDAVIAQDMPTMGRLAVRNIMHDRSDLRVPPMTRVPPLLITRDNVDAAKVQRVLVMNWVPQ